jgi:hypothetical protein
MGVTMYYCPRCSECLHSDCFDECYRCFELITDSKCKDGYLCDECDKDYIYKDFKLCAHCNPNFGKNKKKKIEELMEYINESK